MARLTVAHANVYQGNPTPGRAVATLAGLGADSVGVNEALRIRGRLRRLEGYRCHMTRHGVMRRGYTDTPVLVDKRHEAIGEVALKLSDAVPWKLKLAPDRWAHAALYRARGFGAVAHVSAHLNAGKRKSAEYRKSVRRLGRLLSYLHRAGYHVILTADVNAGAGSRVYRMLERRGFTWRRRGVDVIAAGPGLRLGRLRVVDGPGADHPWLTTRVRKARRRRRG